MRPRQPQQAKASSFRYPPGSAPRDPPPGKLKPLYTRSNSESVAFEQQSISIVALRRTFNACATSAPRPSMLLQAHAGQRGTSVAQATSLGLAGLVGACRASQTDSLLRRIRPKNVTAA